MKLPSKSSLAPWLAACCLAGALPAHGGQYRGPGAPAMPGVPMPPGTPVPTTPGPGTPVTGAQPTIPEEASWQVWWELNKDPFVQPQPGALAGPTTGSDDFYLGRRRGVRAETLAPNAIDVLETVVPALVALLEKDRNRDVQTACLMALAKIGRAPQDVDLEALFAARLARDNQEVRETAALALGVAGRPAAVPLLLSLLRDEPAGRKLCEREKVEDRTRAFAAYGLGLLCDRVADAAVQRLACDALTTALADPREADRNVLVAAVHGLGLLRAPGDEPAFASVRRDAADALTRFLRRDEGPGLQFVQSHGLQALARLAVDDPAIDAQLKERCRDELLGKDARRSRAVDLDRSAILALGERCASDEDGKGPDAALSALLAELRGSHRDEQARHFATMALGRIGGARNRERLLNALPTARKAIDRPWVALALGVLAHEARRADRAAGGDGAPDAFVGEALATQFAAAREPGLVSALGVALGLAGHRDAAPAMRERILGEPGKEDQAGYLCIGLALMRDRGSVECLRTAMAGAARRPAVLQQAAMALGMLGDKTAARELTERLAADGQNLATFAALAMAIGRIGDRSSVGPLLGVLADPSRAELPRAFAAAALGGVVDARAVPWSFRISEGVNYRAAVETLTNRSAGVLDIL